MKTNKDVLSTKTILADSVCLLC